MVLIGKITTSEVVGVGSTCGGTVVLVLGGVVGAVVGDVAASAAGGKEVSV